MTLSWEESPLLPHLFTEAYHLLSSHYLFQHFLYLFRQDIPRLLHQCLSQAYLIYLCLYTLCFAYSYLF